jgi:hypothetical protein
MNRETPGHDSAIGPREGAGLVQYPAARWIRRSIAPSAASDRLGWVGMEAARYADLPDTEVDVPPLTHHTLVLFNRPPDEMDLRYEDVDRHAPPPAGSISVIPAGSPVRWRWSGSKDSLHVFLEPRLVAQVAAESFELDPARVVVPPLDRLDLPRLRAAMQAVDAELRADEAGGNLAAESLANVLAVYLIRHVSAPRRPARDPDGKLPRPPRRQPDSGGIGRRRASQPVPLRAAVPGGHRAAAAPVRHRPPRRAGQAVPSKGRRPPAGAGGLACRVLGPEPVCPTLQAAGRRDARPLSLTRKIRQ